MLPNTKQLLTGKASEIKVSSEMMGTKLDIFKSEGSDTADGVFEIRSDAWSQIKKRVEQKAEALEPEE